MQEVLGEVDDVNEEEMGDECDQHNIDAASGFGNLEMGRLGDSQEGLEENGSDKEEQVNDEPLEPVPTPTAIPGPKVRLAMPGKRQIEEVIYIDGSDDEGDQPPRSSTPKDKSGKLSVIAARPGAKKKTTKQGTVIAARPRTGKKNTKNGTVPR